MRSAAIAQARAARDAHGARADTRFGRDPLASYLCFQGCVILSSSRESRTRKPPHSLGIRLNNLKPTNNQQLGLSTVLFEGEGLSED